jgi:hypothetical protein
MGDGFAQDRDGACAENHNHRNGGEAGNVGGAQVKIVRCRNANGPGEAGAVMTPRTLSEIPGTVASGEEVTPPERADVAGLDRQDGGADQ